MQAEGGKVRRATAGVLPRVAGRELGEGGT